MGWLDSKAKKIGGQIASTTKKAGRAYSAASTPEKGAAAMGAVVFGDMTRGAKGTLGSLGADARKFSSKLTGGAVNPQAGGGGGGGGESPFGMPKIGDYEAAYGGGTYTPPSATALSGPQDFQGMEAMRAVAKENPWLGLAKTRQGLEEQTALQQAGKLAGQAARQAQSNLAMRGGLRSGASERMARQGALEQALAQQNVRNQGALTRAGFDVEGERMRQGMLGQLAGAEQGYAGYQTGAQQWNALQAAESDKWGREQAIQEGIRKGDYGKYKFGEEAKMYGAGKTADAIARSGGTNSSIWNQLNPFAKA